MSPAIDTNDLWNAALDRAIKAVENDRDIPSTYRFHAADIIRKQKRPPFPRGGYID